MKFVMDTSKYWFKPTITRDQGTGSKHLCWDNPSQTCWSLPPRSTSVQLLPVLSSWGDSVTAIQSTLGAGGHGETLSQV